jgi:hypothetical protein
MSKCGDGSPTRPGRAQLGKGFGCPLRNWEPKQSSLKDVDIREVPGFAKKSIYPDEATTGAEARIHLND